jgi:hypothetical protein
MGDLSLTMALVDECSHTLESLDITCTLLGQSDLVRVCTDNLLLFLDGSEPASIDLSKATKLKDVVFQPKSWSVEWITTALRTITPKHRDLRQISIHDPCSVPLPALASHRTDQFVGS